MGLSTMSYLLECLVVYKTGRILWDFKLALLDLFTELPKAESVTHVHMERNENVATQETRKTQPGRHDQLGFTHMV